MTKTLVYHKETNSTYVIKENAGATSCMAVYKGYTPVRCDCSVECMGWIYPKRVDKCPV